MYKGKGQKGKRSKEHSITTLAIWVNYMDESWMKESNAESMSQMHKCGEGL